MYARSLYKFILLTAGVVISISAVNNRLRNNDFGKEFGTKYTDACSYLKQHGQSFNYYQDLSGVNEKFMQAIVFPEVMRYNEVYDGIQVESLKVLYKQWGSDYADFSIGHFQMKPSFAVKVEQQLPFVFTKEEITVLGFYKILGAPEDEQRALRLQYLENTDWQVKYLAAFIRICNRRFIHQSWKNEAEKLSWYATVYNRGLDCDDDQIRKTVQRAGFYLEKGMPGKKYCYAAIAQYFFKN